MILFDVVIKRNRRYNMDEKVKEVIDKIRPLLQADGGDVEFVSIENGVVKVRLRGACMGCPASTMTLKMGIEAELKKAVPGIKSVVAI